MTHEQEASRTLVKSPPELWAELSDPASLARHLSDFGEIRITRLEPETAVAWEGDSARGTVRLEPSGWGTRVVLTARADSDAADATESPVPPRPAPPAPVPDPDPPAPSPDPAPPAPLPDPQPLPPAARLTAARGLLERVLRFVGPQNATPPPRPTPPAAARTEAVEPADLNPRRSIPPPSTSTPPPSPPAPDPADSATAASLSAALDSLGQAHHRPYSRA